MPRYYLSLQGSGAADLDGQDFPDDAAAIIEVKKVAADLRQGHSGPSPERLVVKNEKGETIHEEPLTQ
jgi:hypothetical protein